MNTRRMAVVVGLLLFTLVGVTAGAQLQPKGKPGIRQVIQLCDLTNCSAPPPPPQIVRVSAPVTPGGVVDVYGSGFGNAPGRLWLSAGPYGRDLDLTIPWRTCQSGWPCPIWRDDYIEARVPGDISGWPDQTMTLVVLTQGGAQSNAWSVFFRAARDIVGLPNTEVQVVRCDRYSSVNICLTIPPAKFYSIEGLHSEDWFGHGGKDVYSAAVRNGWVFYHAKFDVVPEGPLGGTWATVTNLPPGEDTYTEPYVTRYGVHYTIISWNFPPGTVSTTVTVDWGTGFWGRLYYNGEFLITGPRGIPYK